MTTEYCHFKSIFYLPVSLIIRPEYRAIMVVPISLKIGYDLFSKDGLCPPNIAAFIFHRWAQPTLRH